MDSANWLAIWAHGTRSLDRAGELFCGDGVWILDRSQMVITRFPAAGLRDCGIGRCSLDVCNSDDFGCVSVTGDRTLAEQFLGGVANDCPSHF